MKKKLNFVLLVDDDKYDNFFHQIILKKAGLADHIEIVLNGREALDILTSKENNGQGERYFFQPELIFLDINMPVMDGWEFLEEYQKIKDSNKANIVIIILTNSINPMDEIEAEKFIKSGCFQYKPLTVKMLDEIMEQHFPDYL